MKKVIKLNESELRHLVHESVRRILAEDESLGFDDMPEEFDGEDYPGIGPELTQDERWDDYDEAQREHEVNMLNDHPNLYDKPEGYEIPKDFGWQDGNDESDEPMGFDPMDDEEPLEQAIAEAVNRVLMKESRKAQANRRAKTVEEAVNRVYARMFGKK